MADFESEDAAEIARLRPETGDPGKIGNDQNIGENAGPAPEIPDEAVERHFGDGDDGILRAVDLGQRLRFTQNAHDRNAFTIAMFVEIVIQAGNRAVAQDLIRPEIANDGPCRCNPRQSP